MRPAVIYARQSRTNEGSESLERQVEACREAAARLDLKVVEQLVEPPSTSGYKNRGKNRAKFNDLLAGFRDGRWEVVIAYKTDRLSRGGGPGWAPLLEAIDGAGLNVDRSVATPSGFVSEFEIGIRASMDREESKKLSERMLDINAKKATNGKYSGGMRPYGFESDGITHRQAEAAILREAVDKVVSGWSYTEVVRWANRQGAVTVTGKPWSNIWLLHRLRYPRYAGIRKHHDERYKAAWEPIIDPVMWERLQTVMDARARNPRAHNRRHLLTGLL